MNAALLLAWLLAQAEAAPAPAPPPATPLPLAQAVASDGAQALGVFARLAFRPAGSEAQLGPNVGFSIGGTYQRRLLRLDAPDAPTLDVGLALDFFHDQFQTAVDGGPPNSNSVQPNQSSRLITHTGFSLSPLLAVPISRLRFWLSAGAGVAIAYFSTPEPALSPGSATAVQPQLTGGAGITVTVRPNIDVGVRADFTHPLTHSRFTPTLGPTVTVWGDLLDFGVGLFYRF